MPNHDGPPVPIRDVGRQFIGGNKLSFQHASFDHYSRRNEVINPAHSPSFYLGNLVNCEMQILRARHPFSEQNTIGIAKRHAFAVRAAVVRTALKRIVPNRYPLPSLCLWQSLDIIGQIGVICAAVWHRRSKRKSPLVRAGLRGPYWYKYIKLRLICQ